MSVSSGQRFTEDNPCPICFGYESLPHGQRRRCWGFLDGAWAVCTRKEMSGGLPHNDAGYSHLLARNCRCGNDHGGWNPPTVSDQNRPARTQDTSLYARRLWDEAVEAQGTVVETYFVKSRGITAPVPPAVRFHRSLKHRPSGKAFPAMVAAVMRWPGTDVTAIHRTYLLPDGSGMADVNPAKMSLGPVVGGAVRLGLPAARMAISEGIEDGMSALQDAGIPVWAATSASAMRSIALPELPMAAEVVICVDGDPAGKKAAAVAADRWTFEGRVVRLTDTPDGKDFNDILRNTAVHTCHP